MATTSTAPTLTEAHVPSDTTIKHRKPIHALVLDTGPLIQNDPSLSTLLAQSQELYTLPSVLSEIRDAATRTRVQTQLVPFLKLRTPKTESVKFVTDFARRTGDLEVLSRTDLQLIALTYELECERNHGDWRLRKVPGQKTLNGKPPTQKEKEKEKETTEEVSNQEGSEARSNSLGEPTAEADATSREPDQPGEPAGEADTTSCKPEQDVPAGEEDPVADPDKVSQQLESLQLQSQGDTAAEQLESEDDDGEGEWITPSNLKKHQLQDKLAGPEKPIDKFLQVALLTSDYAMQNVLLRMNLNLVSPSLARITRLKTWVLRCHGCFQITREMSKQFCPRCGQPNLTRVSCSTDQSGNFNIYLKKNFQWNNRGNVYSLPKPTHGTANGKHRGQGGGKNGWGTELLLAEDQKEYTKKLFDDKRLRQKDLMDEDYLPSILTGERKGGTGRVRVGAGRNVNSKKRH